MNQINATTGATYQGMNQQFLAMTSFESNKWATFLQWRNAGYKVLKGSKGNHIRTFAEVSKVVKKTNGKSKVVSGHAPRCYTVFNSEQVEKVAA